MISQHLKTPIKPLLKAVICRLLHAKPAGPDHTTTTNPLTRGSLLSFQAFPLPSVLSADLCRQLNQHLRLWTLAQGAPPSPTPRCSSIPAMRDMHTPHAHARTHAQLQSPLDAFSLFSHANKKSKTQSHQEDRFFRSTWSVGAGHLHLICCLERTFAKIHSVQGGSSKVPSHWEDLAIYGCLNGQWW